MMELLKQPRYSSSGRSVDCAITHKENFIGDADLENVALSVGLTQYAE